MNTQGSYCYFSLHTETKKILSSNLKYFKNPLKVDDLHCTILCDDNTLFNYNENVIHDVTIKDIQAWGYEKDGKRSYNLVLILDNSIIEINQKISSKTGAKHYFYPYTPHITISYDGCITEIKSFLKNKLIGKKIKLQDIKTKSNNPYWKNKYLED